MNTVAKVVIVIVNWNGWQDTIECPESVFQINFTNFDVILVDNYSQDNSLEKIRDYCSGKLKVKSKVLDYHPENKPIKVIESDENETSSIESNEFIIIKNKENYGFPGGNNVGIKFALEKLDPDYILLLNNDILNSDKGTYWEVHERFTNNNGLTILKRK